MAERKTSSPEVTLEMSGAWRELPWHKLEKYVYRVQKRIYRAGQHGNTRQVEKLQKLLLKSEAARLLAVRRVTQENQGKKTAGVDGWSQIRPTQRTLAHGQTAPDETLDISQKTATGSKGLDTQARQGRKATTWYATHDGTRQASLGQDGPRASLGSEI